MTSVVAIFQEGTDKGQTQGTEGTGGGHKGLARGPPSPKKIGILRNV